MSNVQMIAKALTIAGSDSGGGAGIQADLKTFAALGVYGMSAITALTAQNTLTVAGVQEVESDFVKLQIQQVAEDIGVDAAKTGMLFSSEIISCVAECIRRYDIEKLVVDPVMIAKSGDALLRDSAQKALRREILPLAYVLTPNLPEAEVLSGAHIRNKQEMQEAARILADMGPRYVLMKGGHLESEEAADILYDGKTFTEYKSPRIQTKNTHGTGCTYSAAITACLAKGASVEEAVGTAKEYLTEAIRRSLPLGRGHGPLNHGWRQEGML